MCTRVNSIVGAAAVLVLGCSEHRLVMVKRIVDYAEPLQEPTRVGEPFDECGSQIDGWLYEPPHGEPSPHRVRTFFVLAPWDNGSLTPRPIADLHLYTSRQDSALSCTPTLHTSLVGIRWAICGLHPDSMVATFEDSDGWRSRVVALPDNPNVACFMGLLDGLQISEGVDVEVCGLRLSSSSALRWYSRSLSFAFGVHSDGTRTSMVRIYCDQGLSWNDVPIPVRALGRRDGYLSIQTAHGPRMVPWQKDDDRIHVVFDTDTVLDYRGTEELLSNLQIEEATRSAPEQDRTPVEPRSAPGTGSEGEEDR